MSNNLLSRKNYKDQTKPEVNRILNVTLLRMYYASFNNQHIVQKSDNIATPHYETSIYSVITSEIRTLIKTRKINIAAFISQYDVCTVSSKIQIKYYIQYHSG